MSNLYTNDLVFHSQQYTVGIATGVPVTFISVGENTQDGSLGGFLDIINALLAEDNPPQGQFFVAPQWDFLEPSIAIVLTTSYGDNESAISSKVAKCVHTFFYENKHN